MDIFGIYVHPHQKMSKGKFHFVAAASQKSLLGARRPLHLAPLPPPSGVWEGDWEGESLGGCEAPKEKPFNIERLHKRKPK